MQRGIFAVLVKRFLALLEMTVLGFVLTASLTGCKIDLNILGSGTVQTTSGSFDCSTNAADNPEGCSQVYNTGTDDEPCSGTNCTTITEGNSVTETFAATADQGQTFSGWSGGCWMGGVGLCGQEITYDNAQENQTVEINATFDPEPQPQAASYTYNYLGQRMSKTVTVDSVSTTTYFIYDEQGDLLDEVDEEGHAIKAYIYLEGEYVAHVEQTANLANNEDSNEQLFYPINDHLGQPVQVWRTDTQLAHEQYTDPFGNLYASYTNGSESMGVTHEQTVGLPGQQRDMESGYLYNWNRTLDPSTGGYTQTDPAGMVDGPNVYAYVGGNPVMYVDPKGLSFAAGLSCAIVIAGLSASDMSGIWNTYTDSVNKLKDQLDRVNKRIGDCKNSDELDDLMEAQALLLTQLAEASKDFAQQNAITNDIKDTFNAEIVCGILALAPFP